MQNPKGLEARDWVAKGATLLDVRTPDEFAKGHLPGALNVPVQELPARAGEVPGGKPVVVYCMSGRRSAEARRLLELAGKGPILDLGSADNW
jgi:phage shock protein E